MQKLFDEVNSLDKRCYSDFYLSEDILMEHAANGMAQHIQKNFNKKSTIIIVCGSGNNGADGLALSRLLHPDFNVRIYYAKAPKSKMAILQNKRTKSVGVKECSELFECDIVVDALVGTGFSGEFSDELEKLMKQINSLNAFKIACDIPSGINPHGVCAKETFQADVSLTMGALKKSMFLDEAKEFIGKIEVLNLGISRDLYETSSNWHLLDLDDLQLPFRDKKNSHKGSYGHLAVASGQKSGASVISALAALRFGAGLVTLVGYEDEKSLNIPHSLMYSHGVPKNITALACGMGLGDAFSDLELQNFLDNDLPTVVDADIFHMPIISDILKREKLVITPHPKEFISLLKALNIANISITELQKNRFKYCEEFCLLYPHVILLLKGVNVIIGHKDSFFINPHGTSALAKAGSGDVLSGLIASLLAQGFEPIDATINASLAHTTLSCKHLGADFTLTPDDLIDNIKML
ncbi:NAD(P)H-hydrate dehydratase [Sulfurimonas aquatica]|uniref:Bifunctional NAD(P)H-hydrate repair enzyme n=1 Tax=Sulfurimonas aquatica TaxID=2672570 RepID=A0A975AYF3_9BACT|nr:NAD(P)H-hydrate dehydratase [Sulfurimonas aquatica]QSZ40785.1 NAD(P)H-hydrate dehydratase [Sulfurimonas aquatica]